MTKHIVKIYAVVPFEFEVDTPDTDAAIYASFDLMDAGPHGGDWSLSGATVSPKAEPAGDGGGA